MFGRRGRSRIRPDHSQDVVTAGDISSEPPETDTSPLDTVTADQLPPLRAPGAGNDSGLAEIEAEFRISDADIALLELGALEFAPPLSPLDTKLAEGRDELATTMDQLREQLSARLATPVDLEPYLMLPERCWEGQHREALIELLGLTPTQTWNLLPLAGNPQTAQALGIIEHPRGAPLHAIDAALSFLDDIITKMQSRCEAATFSHDGIDGEALEAAREQARSQVRGLARHIAGASIGTEVVSHTRATFFGD